MALDWKPTAGQIHDDYHYEEGGKDERKDPLVEERHVRGYLSHLRDAPRSLPAYHG